MGELGGRNVYAFVFNSPLRYIDYLGLNPMLEPYDPGGGGGNPMLDPYPILDLDPVPDPPGSPPFGPDNPFLPDPNDPPVAWSGEYRCSVTSMTSADTKECIPYSCNLLSSISGNPPSAAPTSPNKWEIDTCQSCPNNVTFTLSQGLNPPLVPVPSQ